jgi:S-adenosylmethionine:tRNA ribosyltransferase-isomerase
MRTEAFDFELPEALIALRPAEPRGSARLLHVRPGAEPPFADLRVGDLPGLLRAGDVLVLNDTKVIPAQLHGNRRGGWWRAMWWSLVVRAARASVSMKRARPAR